MIETSEQDFEELDDFFNYCTKKTGKEINSYTLNRTFKSTWDSKNNMSITFIDDKFQITFDSGGFTLIEN